VVGAIRPGATEGHPPANAENATGDERDEHATVLAGEFVQEFGIDRRQSAEYERRAQTGQEAEEVDEAGAAGARADADPEAAAADEEPESAAEERGDGHRPRD